MKRGGDQRRVAGEQSGIIIGLPTSRQSVGVHYQNRMGGPGIGAFLDLGVVPDYPARRSQMHSSAAGDQTGSDVAHAGEADFGRAVRETNLGHRHRRAPRAVERLVSDFENLGGREPMYLFYYSDGLVRGLGGFGALTQAACDHN